MSDKPTSADIALLMLAVVLAGIFFVYIGLN